MIERSLKALGLADDETAAYLALLEHGPMTVSALAKLLGKPRPSFYGFLDRLRKKGIVVLSSHRSVRMYAAEDPARVALLFEKKRDELAREHAAYQNLLPSLRKRMPHVSGPKFQLYEGPEGLQFVLRDMLLCRNIETYAFWPIKKMVDMLSPDFFRYHNTERIKRDIHVKAIWPAEQAVSVKDYPYLGTGAAYRREIRIAPKSIDCSMGYWIYGHKVAFLSSRKEQFGFIIESQELADMLLSQHRLIWQLSKPVRSQPQYEQRFLNTLKRV